MTDELIDEQKRYYRARAPEYDDWWYRRGRYDQGEAHRTAWEADKRRLVERVEMLLPVGSLLELAAGTGTWTEVLLPGVTEATIVDAAPEVLAINREKCRALGLRVSVEHREADVFDLDLGRRYELVFFSFWLSHVPEDRFESFWAIVDRHLAPDGRVFLIDNAHPDTEAGDGSGAGTGVNHLEAGTATRTLADGRTFEIVKRFWHPPDLDARLHRLGWRATAETTDRFFLHALVQRAGEPTR